MTFESTSRRSSGPSLAERLDGARLRQGRRQRRLGPDPGGTGAAATGGELGGRGERHGSGGRHVRLDVELPACPRASAEDGEDEEGDEDGLPLAPRLLALLRADRLGVPLDRPRARVRRRRRDGRASGRCACRFSLQDLHLLVVAGLLEPVGDLRGRGAAGAAGAGAHAAAAAAAHRLGRRRGTRRRAPSSRPP